MVVVVATGKGVARERARDDGGGGGEEGVIRGGRWWNLLACGSPGVASFYSLAPPRHSTTLT